MPQQQQHAQLASEPENYPMAAPAVLNGFGEMSSGGSHNPLPLGLLATQQQQQSGTVSSASPLVYPYAYPGGHPMASAYHAQQPQQYVQYTSAPLSVHEGSLHMAMMPVYASHIDGQPSGSMMQHPALAPMHSQSNNPYVPAERWPDNQSAYFQQSFPAQQQQHGYMETRMPMEDVINAQVSVADAQQSKRIPSAAPVAESKGLSPVHNAAAVRNAAPKSQRVRHPKEQKPRGGGANNSERRAQNKATAATSSGSDPNQGAERSARASGSRRSSRADRGRKPSKSNAVDAPGEDKPQTARRGRGTHHRSGARKPPTTTVSAAPDRAKE
ncbi:hypothetical protein H4R20_005282 [Coemansia guatemalensis]|uniref:Uncharacterized protein n=1 Tax=Coemansia guatemalensis TaxID=2761395 RepID=A0A9W8LSA6_9FUNG|nr:hypothetical protein H4R20_005282 [Coemansia guatemalensis]